MVYMMRAICLSALESLAKFVRGRPLGPTFFGSAVWQNSHFTPREPAQVSMVSRTCRPVRSLGSTFKLVGAGKLRIGRPPCAESRFVPCGGGPCVAPGAGAG